MEMTQGAERSPLNKGGIQTHTQSLKEFSGGRAPCWLACAIIFADFAL